MLTQDVYQQICPLIPFMEDSLCNHLMYEKIASIEYTKLDKSFSFFLGQSTMNDLEYLYTSTYVINQLDCVLKCIVELCVKDSDEWKICFQKSSELLYMDILNINTMYYWIKKNRLHRYLAIPISFVSEYGENKQPGHACTLIIDNALEEIYFFDPNGVTRYFGINSEYLIDCLMDKYFEDFESKYSMGYSYIQAKKWNPEFLCLNRKFKNSLIENNGNCIILSILFVHLLHLSQKTIYESIKILGSLDDGLLLHIINNYSVGFYNCVFV